jgi:hypothetical protein
MKSVILVYVLVSDVLRVTKNPRLLYSLAVSHSSVILVDVLLLISNLTNVTAAWAA